MGQLISSARDALKQADNDAEKKTKQDLDILQKLVDLKLDEFQSQLNEMFMNPDNTAKTQIPGVRALRWERRSFTQISDIPADVIDSAVDEFFKIGDKGTETNNVVENGFKGIVKTALSGFLSNTEVGEKNEEKFFVYMAHNTIVRIDIKLYRWNFAGKGFSDTYQSVLGYIMCLSVVDPSKLKTAEFIYLLSDYASEDAENVNHYIETMQKMYSTARKMKLAGKNPVVKEIDD